MLSRLTKKSGKTISGGQAINGLEPFVESSFKIRCFLRSLGTLLDSVASTVQGLAGSSCVAIDAPGRSVANEAGYAWMNDRGGLCLGPVG